MTYSLNGITPLSHLGVIRVEGEDAAKFLHGQLTQDFELLPMDQARLAAFLSAKGRMQASFIGIKRSATEILLVCSRDLLAPTLKRLSMFVLRAKARLTDASSEFAVYGLAGDSVPGGSQSAWTKADVGAASVVHLYPAEGQPRALWVAPASEPAPSGPALEPSLWDWSEVRSGVATLAAPLVEAFVPQMLNYESVGGVNFKKGCYPGQEVVARSQFRGAIKRRAALAHSQQALSVGMEVFTDADSEQAVGLVVQAAAAPGGGWDAIVAVQVAAQAEPLFAHAALAEGQTAQRAAGAALQMLPVPYALLDDI
jgi:folate-binding protein YgfZ